MHMKEARLLKYLEEKALGSVKKLELEKHTTREG